MLPTFDRFIFPEIEGIRRHSQDGFVCQLDWSAKNTLDTVTKSQLLLPEEYNQMVEEQKFCIPFAYHKEIERCTLNALTEWNQSRKFDSNIEDKCLSIGQEYIKTAFMLIADSAMDYHPSYFGTEILKSAMLYKFWSNQTGAALVSINAGLQELENMANQGLKVGACKEDDCLPVWKFIDTISAYEKEKLNKRTIVPVANRPETMPAP